MSFIADSKWQRLHVPLIFHSFLVIHSNRKMSPTIYCKFKVYSTVQTAEDRRQKVHFCPLPFDLMTCINLANHSFLYRSLISVVIMLLQKSWNDT